MEAPQCRRLSASACAVTIARNRAAHFVTCQQPLTVKKICVVSQDESPKFDATALSRSPPLSAASDSTWELEIPGFYWKLPVARRFYLRVALSHQRAGVERGTEGEGGGREGEWGEREGEGGGGREGGGREEEGGGRRAGGRPSTPQRTAHLIKVELLGGLAFEPTGLRTKSERANRSLRTHRHWRTKSSIIILVKFTLWW